MKTLLEERYEAYSELIDQIILSSDEQIRNLLQANSDLIDLGLLMTMTDAAYYCAENNNPDISLLSQINIVNKLQDLSQSLVQAMGFGSYYEMLEEYHNCLMEILSTVGKNPSPDFVYPVFVKHLDKLNFNLAISLDLWTQNILPDITTREAQEMAHAINHFEGRISEFPLGDLPVNKELAIIACQIILKVFTKSDFPKDWAITQNNLGNAYSDRIRGNQAENLELAIEFFDNALTILTQGSYPQYWAMTQSNLGIAYRNRIRGNKAENIEKAIECYENALTIRDPINSPRKWANTQLNLGVAYSDRIEGNKAENLELEIECYEKALTIFTKIDFPQKWSEIRHNLGAAYYNRIRGDRADNLEKTIEYYNQVLIIHTKANNPHKWAMTQYHLGNAYSDRLKGDRADNLEEAIKFYQEALTVFTKSDFPDNWAMTQNSLGCAYSDRIKGDKAENLELSIEYFENSLTIRTLSDFSQQWAMTQNSLGIAYENRMEGNKAENLEKAIEYYENALTVCTKSDFPDNWAMTQNNLGIAYENRMEGDKTGNLEKAIKYYENALTVYTKSDFPDNWAMTQNNLGIAYKNRMEGDKTENLEKAIEYFENALTIYSLEIFTFNHLKISRNLGNLYSIQGNWPLAIEAYRSAIDALEIIRSTAQNDQRRQEILTESIDIYENMVQACIEDGQIELAIETSERSRGKHLAELMASKEIKIHPEIEAYLVPYLEEDEALEVQKAQLQRILDSENQRTLQGNQTKRDNQELIASSREQIKQIYARQKEIWLEIRKVDPFLAGQKTVELLPFTQIKSLITEKTTAILSFYSTWEDTYLFIIYQDRPPQVHCYSDQGRSQLHGDFLLNNWLKPYLRQSDPDPDKRDSAWRDNISTVLQQISQRLQIDQLIDTYLQNIEELIIIPHLWLHQIPFAALPIKEVRSMKSEVGSFKEVRSIKSEIGGFEEVRGMGGIVRRKEPETAEKVTYLGDKFRLRILPSCQILNYCHQRPPLSQPAQMGLIENASEDLPYSAYECHILAQTYPIQPHHRLQGQQATVQNCRNLLKQVQTVHFSHHAQAAPDDPLESRLVLSDRTLSLRELLSWRFPHLSDGFLNNCETNFSVNKMTDDLLTLSSGLLCIGARNVVSTLWSVDDCASALLSLFYYEIRQQIPNRSRALQKAQQKLRNLTGEQLKQDYSQQLEQHLHKLYQDTFRVLETSRFKDSETYQTYQKRLKTIDVQIKYTLPRQYREKYPFESPYYWAGFISQGL